MPHPATCHQVGEGEIERRDEGTALAEVDESLSCARFADDAWLRANRPTWPAALVEKVERYAATVPQGTAPVDLEAVKKKDKKSSQKDCTLVLGRPGIGDATPCF